MEAQEHSRLKIVIVGHVDHGKSTLIGRLFHDTDSLPEGKAESIRAACEAEGMEFEYAFLLDSLLEEQEQNITIDTTQIQFRTPLRNYVIIDAPGHKEFLKNMITGAASADAALLLIAANEGVREQSCRHGYLLSMLGIKQVAVLVNKMDLIDFDQKEYERICREYEEFLHKIGVEPSLFVPVSAKLGHNVARRANREMPWHEGPTILEALDQFQLPQAPVDQPLRLPVQDIYRFDERRIIAGRIESGSLKVGDRLLFSPQNKTSTVASIEAWSAPEKKNAGAGESVGITLEEQIFIQRGSVASLEVDTPIETNRFRARIFWMGKKPLPLHERRRFKLATQEVDGSVVAIEKLIDASTLEVIEEERTEIQRNDVAEVVVETRGPLVIDNHDRIPLLGRFIIEDNRQVAGGGIVFGGVYTDRSAIKSQNIFWSEGEVTTQQRFLRNGHKGAVIWLTGLSGSGKSTLARALERELFNRGLHVYVLDGDNIRHGLNSNLGFSPEDRAENIRRISEVGRLMADAGTVVITAFISPYRIDRRRAREIALEAGCDFVEIYVNAPLEVCEQRDPKNLYKKARAGEIKQFTGIDAPYEPPEEPEIEVHTDRMGIEEAVTTIMESLLPRVEFRVDPSANI